MKKVELILAIVAIVSVVLKVYSVEWAFMLALFSLTTLAMLYFYSGVYYPAGVWKLKSVFSSNGSENVDKFQKLVSLIAGISIALTILGVLFKIMNWPQATVQLQMGIIGTALSTLLVLFKYAKSKPEYFLSVIKRTAIYGSLGILVLLVL
ncbi:MAG: hypothetical protein GXO48_04355 [Chlorobi bacterium]|nr:hypothetical protein [Chlorobiota bacterium]